MAKDLDATIEGGKGIVRAPRAVNETGTFQPRQTVKGLVAKDEVEEVLLDLEEMERVNSVSLGEFVACHVACVQAGKTLRIVNAQPNVAGVLRMCHIDRVIDVKRAQG